MTIALARCELPVRRHIIVARPNAKAEPKPPVRCPELPSALA
jgi:hypothetical protein